MRCRLKYLSYIAITIILGLLSRYFKAIPLWIGDGLWATMVFYISRFWFIDKPVKSVVIISLIFCYGIEVSQLYQASWINQIRQTLFGKLVLGSVFSWGDMLSYTIGVVLGILTIIKADKLLAK